MNFRFTPLKTIVSIIVGFIVDFLMASSVKVACSCISDSAPCKCSYGWADFALDPGTLMVSVVSMLLVYCIWSLIQR